jgi:hypothetical protein
MLPINNWSQPMKISDVAVNRDRPPSDEGLVYVVSGLPDPAKDVKYVGSAHATGWTDGLERVGSFIGAMLGFYLWHSGGIKLYRAYPWQQINGF